MNDRLQRQRQAQVAKGFVTKPPAEKLQPPPAPPGAPGKPKGKFKGKPKKPNRGQRNAKFTQERLPNHSAFEATWNAEKVEWVGSLHVRDGEQARTFAATSKTLFTLVSSLDRQFRAWVKSHPPKVQEIKP